MHSEWAAHTPELIKGDGPIIFKVLGLARGAKDREDTLYPFTLRLEGVAHKIELVRASSCSVCICFCGCVYVKEREKAGECRGFHVPQTKTKHQSPPPSSSQNWSMTKETYNLLVETRADGWSFHFETTSPCPFKGQLWCGGNLIKAAHVAIFDRSNPEILRWRHVQVEKLLQAVVADREVGVVCLLVASDGLGLVGARANHITALH